MRTVDREQDARHPPPLDRRRAVDAALAEEPRISIALEQADPPGMQAFDGRGIEEHTVIAAAAQPMTQDGVVGHPLGGRSVVRAQQAQTDIVGMEEATTIGAFDIELYPDRDGATVPPEQADELRNVALKFPAQTIQGRGGTSLPIAGLIPSTVPCPHPDWTIHRNSGRKPDRRARRHSRRLAEAGSKRGSGETKPPCKGQ